ncbi:beta-glucosidase 12-like isoform X2 [Mercurialis annua]|uniref:beta-glucosidase 12-like isoform X2 n=1 Tax=Mercurialis annua TaxID=3986 RepID=UPI00215E6E80|nr:beta-glucosidase 12-like isoform X2 [Mercurialis annua]
MATTRSIVLLILMISLLAYTHSAIADDDIPQDFDRSYFPPGFIFGSSTSAYQIEGKANKKCRGPSIWDTFSHEQPGRIADGSNADVADDSYDRYKDDIELMEDMGLDAYRFSISWSRLIPSGRIREGVNEEGIEFYNRVINELIEQDMEPFVTLFHWDVPQALEDKYGGFLSRDIVKDFKDFAELCFEKFGDRVKKWITVNEPWTFSSMGYDRGTLAPGRCSTWVNKACQAGNSSTEPYIVNHNLLFAHATAARLYREKFQVNQKGKIGVTVVSNWYEPYNSEDHHDRKASLRSLDFVLGWFLHPLTYGHYPVSMQKLVGDRLPKFVGHESEFVKGTFDFLGLNYYTGYYASSNFSVDPDPTHLSYSTDSHVNVTAYKNGVPIGKPTSVEWLYVYPQGMGEAKNETSPDNLDDPWRKDYYKSHLWNVLGSIDNHTVPVKGYFAWSFMDNYEWASGYTVRFGLYYIDYKNNLTRLPKTSVDWFENFLDSGYRTLKSAAINEDASVNANDV